MKKCVCFIFALCCLLTGCTLSCDDNISSSPVSNAPQYMNSYPFEYTETEDGVTITQYQDSEETSVEIPSQINGRDVVAVGTDLFFPYRHVQSVTLPDSLIMIEGAAFYKNQFLKEICIPKNVRCIDDNVFYGCVSLQEITVHPDNAYFCSVDGVLFDREMTTLLIYPEGKAMEQYNVPEGVQSIQVSAFGHKFPCQKLGIPASVKSIYFDKTQGIVWDTLDDDMSRRSITLVVYPGTYAEQYAQKNGYAYEYVEEKTTED